MSKVKAGEAYVRLSLDDQLQAGLNKASKQMKAFGQSVAIAGAGISALGAGIVLPIVAAAKNFASFGDNLDKVSARTGVAVESLSELGFAAEQSGASITDLEKGIRGMQRGMFDAKRGAGEMLDALKELGLEYKDLADLSPEEQFELIGDRLAGIENDSIRAAVAMKAFGKSGSALLPMYGSIRGLREEARALGITMTTDSAKSAADLTDAMNKLSRVFLAIKVNIGAAVAPLLTDLTTRLSYALGEVIKFVKANKEFIVTALKVGAAISVIGGLLIGIGGSIAVLGFAFGGLATAIGVFGSVLAAILSPITLLISSMAALGYSIVTYTDIGANSLNWLKAQFTDLYNYVANIVKFIAGAFEAGGIDLAVKAAWAVIKLEFLTGANYINEIWLGIYENALHAWNQITTGVANALQTISQIGLNAANFISKTFWDAAQAIIDAFAYVGKSVAKSLYLTKAISGNTYGDIVEEIRQLQEAGKNFTDSQKEAAENVYGGAVKDSQNKQKQNEEDFRKKSKEIADEFANGGQSLRDELAAARKEYDDIASTVKTIPEETKQAVEKVKQSVSAISEAGANTTSSGTFSAAAARGLNISGIDTIAKYTQETAKNTAKLAENELAFT